MQPIKYLVGWLDRHANSDHYFTFTGGSDFTCSSLSKMSEVLVESLNNKYGLFVEVSEPIKDRTNVDIGAVPSYEKRSMMVLHPYSVDMGTSGLIVQTQSREEISSGFKQEMRRFLSVNQVDEIIETNNLWTFITYLIEDLGDQMRRIIGK